jgi:hypothetical protein
MMGQIGCPETSVSINPCFLTFQKFEDIIQAKMEARNRSFPTRPYIDTLLYRVIQKSTYISINCVSFSSNVRRCLFLKKERIGIILLAG